MGQKAKLLDVKAAATQVGSNRASRRLRGEHHQGTSGHGVDRSRTVPNTRVPFGEIPSLQAGRGPDTFRHGQKVPPHLLRPDVNTVLAARSARHGRARDLVQVHAGGDLRSSLAVDMILDPRNQDRDWDMSPERGRREVIFAAAAERPATQVEQMPALPAVTAASPADEPNATEIVIPTVSRTEEPPVMTGQEVLDGLGEGADLLKDYLDFFAPQQVTPPAAPTRSFKGADGKYPHLRDIARRVPPSPDFGESLPSNADIESLMKFLNSAGSDFGDSGYELDMPAATAKPTDSADLRDAGLALLESLEAGSGSDHDLVRGVAEILRNSELPRPYVTQAVVAPQILVADVPPAETGLAANRPVGDEVSLDDRRAAVTALLTSLSHLDAWTTDTAETLEFLRGLDLRALEAVFGVPADEFFQARILAKFKADFQRLPASDALTSLVFDLRGGRLTSAELTTRIGELTEDDLRPTPAAMAGGMSGGKEHNPQQQAAQEVAGAA